MSSDSSSHQSLFRRWLSSRALRWSLGGFLAGGIVVAAFAGYTTTMVQKTNDNAYCVDCHRFAAYEEYRQSPHYTNRAGVSTRCTDCHLPHNGWPEQLAAKAVSGVSDLWAHTVEGIDTREEFAQVRDELAREVWSDYRENDSRNCRQCHNTDAWQLTAQAYKARNAHRRAERAGDTCIGCHKGVAHGGHAGKKPSAEVSGSSSVEAADASDSTQKAGDETPVHSGAAAASDDGALGECRQCHLALEDLTSPSLDRFQSALASHPSVGGAVLSLDRTERRRIHGQLTATQ